jgi:hypothetical protein
MNVAAPIKTDTSLRDWEDELLSWYADKKTPMLETVLQLGGLKYFHFSSSFSVADGRRAHSFGNDIDRRFAILKCAGEALERQAMVLYFIDHADQFPKPFRNSNGWAVHFLPEKARRKSMREALERHLLLKSFIEFGWSGFNHIQTIEADDIAIYLFSSRYTCQGLCAGLAVAKSEKFDGISLGNTVGEISEMPSSDFWYPAIFEAADKILLGEEGAEPIKGTSWIHRETNRFLVEPFDISIFGQDSSQSYLECAAGDFHVETIDLSRKLGLSFPFYAAFTSGGNLIPLCWRSELDLEGFEYLDPILMKNGITEFPERHPIL